jgi:hypothetical protein
MRLKKVNLKTANKHECPEIKTGLEHPYLIKVGGQWFAGTFNRQWYGLNFFGWFGGSLQFDAPGSNSSRWEEVYEIIEKKKPLKPLKPESKCPNEHPEGTICPTCGGECAPSGIDGGSWVHLQKKIN